MSCLIIWFIVVFVSYAIIILVLNDIKKRQDKIYDAVFDGEHIDYFGELTYELDKIESLIKKNEDLKNKVKKLEEYLNVEYKVGETRFEGFVKKKSKKK